SVESFDAKAYSDSIYHAYSVFISSAKAMLLDKGINSSTQTGIIRDFDEQYKESSILAGLGSFNDLVLQINKNEPSAEFAQHYVGTTVDFINRIKKEKEAIQS
ncbi:MAG: hypothetical protein B7Y19_06680, partial [Sphingobacteriales bacterium 24-40-4]